VGLEQGLFSLVIIIAELLEPEILFPESVALATQPPPPRPPAKFGTTSTAAAVAQSV
jgi:hypothetical protein